MHFDLMDGLIEGDVAGHLNQIVDDVALHHSLFGHVDDVDKRGAKLAYDQTLEQLVQLGVLFVVALLLLMIFLVLAIDQLLYCLLAQLQTPHLVDDLVDQLAAR